MDYERMMDGFGISDQAEQAARSFRESLGAGSAMRKILDDQNDLFRDLMQPPNDLANIALSQQFDASHRVGDVAREAIDRITTHHYADLFQGMTESLVGLAPLQESIINISRAWGTLADFPNALEVALGGMHPTASIIDTIDQSRFWEQLPDLSELRRSLEEDVRAAASEIIGESDLEVGLNIFTEAALLSFGFFLMRLEEEHGGGDVFYTFVTSDDFLTLLREEINGSSVVRKRFPIVEAAHDAHKREQYLLSIPALLAQFEGVLADSLILKSSVQEKDGKLYEMENGQLKLNTKNEPIAVPGLHRLQQLSAQHPDDMLHVRVSTVATDALIKTRNGIAHGRNVDYADRRLSAQLFAYLLFMSGNLTKLDAKVDLQDESS